MPAAVSSSVPIWSGFPFIAMLGRLAALGCIAVFAHAAVHVPTREIAAGVQMPIISIGGRRPLQRLVRFVTKRRGIGGLETANASAIVSNWLKLGGRGIDTAGGSVDKQSSHLPGTKEETAFTTCWQHLPRPWSTRISTSSHRTASDWAYSAHLDLCDRMRGSFW